MVKKSVLFVGLGDAQRSAVDLPDGVGSATVHDCDEALDHLALTPPDLIVANHTVGDLDSLDLLGKVIEVHPDAATPILFISPPGGGVQPFLYQRRASGFEVRYLDTSGLLQTHFVKEKPTEKSFTVRALAPSELNGEIARLLSGEPPPPDDEDLQQRALELGFNQDVMVRGNRYHVQTEVVAIEPLTISTSVFHDGRAVHSNQQRIDSKQLALHELREQVESIHARTVGCVTAGELR